MTRTNTTPYHTKQRFFLGALSSFLILSGLYMYFVSASVVQVVARKEIEREIVQIDSHIGDLEASYISAKKAITNETISQYGFAPATAEKIYVQRTPSNLVLAWHDED